MDSEGTPHPDSPTHRDEQPSVPDLQQWMDGIWTHVFGFPARSTDVLVVQTISDDTFESRVDAIADLLWDHWMGEPDEPSVEQVRQFVATVGRDMASAPEEDPSEGS